jgi:hypothetical protein
VGHLDGIMAMARNGDGGSAGRRERRLQRQHDARKAPARTGGGGTAGSGSHSPAPHSPGAASPSSPPSPPPSPRGSATKGRAAAAAAGGGGGAMRQRMGRNLSLDVHQAPSPPGDSASDYLSPFPLEDEMCPSPRSALWQHPTSPIHAVYNLPRGYVFLSSSRFLSSRFLSSSRCPSSNYTSSASSSSSTSTCTGTRGAAWATTE